MVEQSPLPVTIIGGYLGSGKTTLVNHLLRNANGKRLAILVNDFGELPIDADLIETADDDIISLTGGCVCCSYGNDLMMAMTDMAKMDPRPDHVILEASGVALPDAIGGSLSLMDGYEVGGLIVMADAETVRSRANDKYMGDTILRQLANANIVALNKIDLVDEEAIETTREWLGASAPNAVVIDTERAALPLEVVLHMSGYQAPAVLHQSHRQLGRFETRGLKMDMPVDIARFAENLIATEPPIIRAKGFLKNRENQMKTFQLVGKRWEAADAPKGVQTGIVIIGTRLPDDLEDIVWAGAIEAPVN